MTWMKRWMGVVTAAAFVATMVPSLAYARGADDLRPHMPKPQKPERPQKPHFARRADDVKPQLPKPHRPEKPHFARRADDVKPQLPKPHRPEKPRFAAKGGVPAPKPAVNPKQQFGKGGKLPA